MGAVEEGEEIEKCFVMKAAGWAIEDRVDSKVDSMIDSKVGDSRWSFGVDVV